MQHEQWLFGGEKYTLPVLAVIDEFMSDSGMPAGDTCCGKVPDGKTLYHKEYEKKDSL